MSRNGFIGTGALCILAGMALAQESNTVFFDNGGGEAGITTPGATDFSVFGANFTGGEVVTEGILRLYASGHFAYEILPGGVDITFDNPVDMIDFFYVHDAAVEPAGGATVFDVDGNVLGTGESQNATFFADPANFLFFDPDVSIARVRLEGGHLDNFSFTTIPAPSVASLVLIAGIGASRRRRP
jgi:hypothetical protein